MTADEALAWSAVLSTSTLLVYVLTGRRTARLRAIGWTVALLSEAGWAYYGWASGGRFFAVQALVFVAVAAWNLATLRRPDTDCRCPVHPDTAEAPAQPESSPGQLPGRVNA